MVRRNNVARITPFPRQLLSQTKHDEKSGVWDLPSNLEEERDEFFMRLGDMCTGEKKWEICEREVERLFGGRGVTMAWLAHFKEISAPLREW